MRPIVERRRLLEKLGRGGVRLVLVAAAPGYGKTVLLRQWLEGFKPDQRAWVTAEPESGASLRFWGRVLTALESTGRPVAADIRLSLGRNAAGSDALAPLVDHFAGQPDETVLVLSDYHAVSSLIAHRQLAWLIDNCPPALRIVISTRHDPLLPTGRWRAREELLELRERDLRLERPEVGALFPGYPDDVVDAVAVRTEGWAAGLQLAALAAPRAADPAAFLRTFDGTEPGIAEFLVQEVLDAQPPDLRDFLLSTAALDAFNASLANAVTGRADSAAAIARLSARHAFLTPVDGRPRWFRYHGLFADVLREESRRLRPERQLEAYRQAGAWHAARGEAMEAIDYALAGGDHVLALDQLLLHHLALSASGGWPAVRRWLETIPEVAIAVDPPRALSYALLLASYGRVGQALVLLGRVEAQLDPEAPPELRAMIPIVRGIDAALNGEYVAFRRHAADADRLLGPAHPAAGAWGLLKGWIAGLAGEFRTSQKDFADAAGHLVPDPAGILGAALEAEALAWQGTLRDAAAKAEAVLARHEMTGSPAVHCALRAAAMVHLEAGQLDDAEHRLDDALASEDMPVPLTRVLHSILRAEVARARGQPDEALATILDAGRLGGARPLGALLRGYLGEARVRAELDLGQVGAAARSVTDVHLPAVAFLLRARIALADGERRSAQLHLSAAALRIPGDALRRSVELHLLRARSLLEANPRRARQHVQEALGLGGPEGLLWTLAQEAELAPLYAVVTGRRPLPGLGALLSHRVGSPGLVIDLVEEPTERELQVLTLLVAGLSYQEVADELFLARNTVKAHAQSIYRKVGAHSREEAAERARQMGLVPGPPKFTPPG